MRRHILCATLLCGIIGMISLAVAAEPNVAIATNFPGGNALVKSNEGNTVTIAPDLRGGSAWFYWCFEATAAQPGTENFAFTGAFVGMQGPAISKDQGKTWQWMGNPVADGKSFTYDFTKAGEKVRFATTIPYLQSDLDAFLKENEGNKYLTVSVLTKSRKGRPVELLQIGQPGPDVKAALFTARHHACETMASLVLEGFVKAAISDTPDAVEFRKNYVLYVVPFVDKDGVEEGDQGKGRRPHDHNRDYGDAPMYPEVKAIQELGEAKNIEYLVDFHCPTLRMEDHQLMYIDGSKASPANNFNNATQLAGLIKKAMPPKAPFGPLVWLKATSNPAMCSGHFGLKNGVLLSIALEIPFAPPKAIMDPATVRKYGGAILNAWVKAKFVAAAAIQ